MVVLGAMGAAVSTQPGQCIRQVNPSAKLPPNWSVYRTDRVCAPYELGERFYGHGYMGYKIVEANRARLRPDGTFAANIDLLLPPDNTGRAVSESLLKKDKYY
jgi:hypothetical protein